MLFVSDKIPPELQRIVEFLNEQMDPAEVLAVEIKQFYNEELKTLVPKVIGLTSRSQMKKGKQSKQWDESSFLEGIEQQRGKEEANIARKIIEWSKKNKLRTWWGAGANKGSYYPMLDHNNIPHYTFAMWTSGDIVIPFLYMKKNPVFLESKKRLELLDKINKGIEMNYPRDTIDKRPSFKLNALMNEAKLKEFLSTFDWYIEEIRANN